jgi:2'-5' RNA ligase
MKRTFVAIDIVASDKLTEVYEQVLYRMRLERINWVALGSLHITLCFLGNTPDPMLSDVAAVITKAVRETAAFELTLRSLGVFRDLRDPHVIWIGCEPSSPMQDIKSALDQQFKEIGFAVDSRPFTPHLTLGRMRGVRQINQLSQLLALYKEVEIQKNTITHVVWFESTLKPDGPEYRPIQRFLLR